MQLPEIMAQVQTYPARHVTVTGGEPLAQRHCHQMLSQLVDAGYHVSLETSGALDVSGVDPRVVKVMDIKTPGSGEEARNCYENVAHLTPRDQVKFVISSEADYQWSRRVIDRYRLADKCEVLVSPVHGELEPATLADWVLADGLNARFQLQLHKILWGDEAGR